MGETTGPQTTGAKRKGYKKRKENRGAHGSERGGEKSVVSGGLPLTVPVQREKTARELATESNTDWVPFFSPDNHFINLLAKLPLISSTHRSIIRSKVAYSVGNGFILNRGRDNTVFSIFRKVREALGLEDKEFTKLNDFAIEVNPSGETLLEVVTKLFTDYYTGGNAYLLIKKFKTKERGQDKAGAALFGLDWTKCRLSRADKAGIVKTVFFADDWAEEVVSDKKNAPLDYPKWPNTGPDPMGTGAEVSVIHIKDYEPGYNYYGLPSAVASILWQQLEHYIPRFNVSEFTNGFSLHLLIQFVANMQETKAQAFIDEFLDIYKGEGQNGGVFAQVIPSEALKANVVNLRKEYDGSFIELDKTGALVIARSHQWPPELAGVQLGNKLGAGKELINQFLIAQANVIEPARRLILSAGINKAIKWLELGDVYLELSNSIPLTFFGDIDPEISATINEKRASMGLEQLDGPGKAELLAEVRATSRASTASTSDGSDQGGNPGETRARPRKNNDEELGNNKEEGDK